MRDPFKIINAACRIVARERQLICENRTLLGRVPLVALQHARLHNSDANVIDHGRGSTAQLPDTEPIEDCERNDSDCRTLQRRSTSRRTVFCIRRKHQGARQNNHGEKRKPVDAKHRN